MKDKFIETHSLGFLDAVGSNFSPLFSSAQARIVLHSCVRQAYQVRRENGAVKIDPFGRYDRKFIVSRAAQETELIINCGLAYDEQGLEYQIVGTLKLSFTIKDDEEAIEKVVRNFDAEYLGFTSFVEKRFRTLVRTGIRQQKAVHAVLDPRECLQALLDSPVASESSGCFCVVAVTSASFGDAKWERNERRNADQAEAIAKIKLAQEMAAKQREAELHKVTKQADEAKAQAEAAFMAGGLQRERDLLREAELTNALRREYTRSADQFRRELENADANEKLVRAKTAFETLGADAALLLLFPDKFALRSGHAERMRDAERKALEQHKAELLEILKEAVKRPSLL